MKGMNKSDPVARFLEKIEADGSQAPNGPCLGRMGVNDMWSESLDRFPYGFKSIQIARR